jgi:hypothetical protein
MFDVLIEPDRIANNSWDSDYWDPSVNFVFSCKSAETNIRSDSSNI